MTNTREERVAVSIEPLTAQTLMDWGVLHRTDAGWTIDLDIWRTRKVEPSPDVWEALTVAQTALDHIWATVELEQDAGPLVGRARKQIEQALARLPDPPKLTVEEDRA